MARRAAELQPRSAVTRYNLGKALEEVADWGGAEQAYRESLALQADFPEAAWSLAQLLWLKGAFAEAWRHYERRLHRRGFERRPAVFDRPAWQGEDFAGKTLLLWAEQGQGDSTKSHLVQRTNARGRFFLYENGGRFKSRFDRG